MPKAAPEKEEKEVIPGVDEEEEKTPDPLEDIPSATILDMFRYADTQDRIFIALGFLLALGNGATLPAFALLFGDMLDALNDEDRIQEESNNIALLFGILGLVTLAASWGEVSLLQVSAERQVRRLRTTFLWSLLRQDAAYHDLNPTDEIVARLTEYSATITEGIGGKLGQMVHFMGTAIGGIVTGLVVDWSITLVIMALVPLIVIGGTIMSVGGSKYEKAIKAAYARAGAFAAEALANIRAVASFGRELTVVARYKRELADAEQQGRTKGFVFGVGMGCIMGGMFLAYGVGLYYGGLRIVETREDHPECRFDFVGRTECITGGSIMQVLFAVLIAGFSLGQAGPYYSKFAAARAAAGKLYSVIDRVPGIDASNPGGERLAHDDVRGNLRLEGVTFSYPTRPDEKALDNVSIDIPAGSVVALVGGSGSGKSTVAKLVQRMYDPAEGKVTLDGHDLKAVNVASLRSTMGVVSQLPALFGVSVAENIRMGARTASGVPATLQETIGALGGGGGEADGAEDVSLEAVKEAARSANAHDFVKALPKGYDTPVGQRGSQLSGGQRQRIAIARALVRKPPILILDEATAALDEQSQRQVQDALDRLTAAGRGRTVLVVAHRLSTIRGADKIVVMDRGKVVETGTHDELLAKPDGHYRGLYLASQEVDAAAGVGVTDEAESGVAAGAGAAGGLAVSAKTLAMTEGAEDTPLSPKTPMSPGLKPTDATDVTAQSSALAMVDEREAIEKQVKAEEEEHAKVPIARIWAYQKDQWYIIVPALIAAAANGALMPLWALVFSDMLTALFDPDDDEVKRETTTYMYYHLGAAAGCLVFQTLQYGLFAMAGERLTRRLRGHTFERLLGAEVAYFDAPTHSPGRLAARLSRDAALVRATTGETFALFAQNLAALITAFAIAFEATWELSLVVLGTFPLMALAGALESQSYVEESATDKEDKHKASAAELAGNTAFEAVTQVQTVQSFGMQGSVTALFDGILSEGLEGQQKNAVNGGFGFAVSQALQFGIYALCFWVGAQFITMDLIDFNDLFRSFFVLTMASYGLGQSAIIAGDVAKAGPATRSIFAILDREAAISPYDIRGRTAPKTETGGEKGAVEKAAGGEVGRAKGRIEFRDVEFAYPMRPDVKVLKGLTFTIEAGQSVAFVGPSGSGKSTIAQLLMRLYDPAEGEIRLDGAPLQEYNVPWLRAQYGTVLQEPVLLRDSVAWNVAFGRPTDADVRRRAREAARAASAGDRTRQLVDGADMEDLAAVGDLHWTDALPAGSVRAGGLTGPIEAVDEDISAAVADSNAADFISEFPNKFGESVGIGGEQLSGGQRQRVAIARALIRKPPILIFDEATSALDRRSEEKVQAALDRVVEAAAGVGQTTITVAHRLRTICRSDVIFVMSEGRIVEAGSHDDLLAKNGLYRRLWDLSEGISSSPSPSGDSE